MVHGHVAVHCDQVIVLTGPRHPKGSGLQLLDLDGRFLRMIAVSRFRRPQAITASRGTVFVVDDDDFLLSTPISDDDDDETGKVLHVIDIQSGESLQIVRDLGIEGPVSAIIVDGDEIYIADNSARQVMVLQLAGSEA